jgi:DNA-binding NarL/FixJ family response regulator
MNLRILIADDHEVVRRGMCALLQAHEGWEICGEAADGREAVSKAKQLQPDIVILDIGMPNLNGLAAASQLMQQSSHYKIIVLTIDDSDQVLREALDAGARGFVLKSEAARQLVAAVEALQNKRMFLPSRANDLAPAGFVEAGRSASGSTVARVPKLTAREREVIQLVAEGKSSKEVASLLNFSVKTAETHRSNILRKLDLHSVADLVLYAVKNRIVQAQMPTALRSM